MKQEIKVKRWVIDKAQETASRYNTYIDFTRRDETLGCPIEDDGYVYVCGEVISETDKAIQAKLESGQVLGSCKGWKVWIPKSQIVRG